MDRGQQWRHGHSVEVETIHRLCDAGLAARVHGMRVVDGGNGDWPRGHHTASDRAIVRS
jgi:hypothetical protein